MNKYQKFLGEELYNDLKGVEEKYIKTLGEFKALEGSILELSNRIKEYDESNFGNSYFGLHDALFTSNYISNTLDEFLVKVRERYVLGVKDLIEQRLFISVENSYHELIDFSKISPEPKSLSYARDDKEYRELLEKWEAYKKGRSAFLRKHIPLDTVIEHLIGDLVDKNESTINTIKDVALEKFRNSIKNRYYYKSGWNISQKGSLVKLAEYIYINSHYTYVILDDYTRERFKNLFTVLSLYLVNEVDNNVWSGFLDRLHRMPTSALLGKAITLYFIQQDKEVIIRFYKNGNVDVKFETKELAKGFYDWIVNDDTE